MVSLVKTFRKHAPTYVKISQQKVHNSGCANLVFSDASKPLS